jgi:protein-disulfide isomerase|tara:strand:- start:3463 stop:4056 length:594 start_codon:yes stop_codon:yes gene_type:complete
MKEIIKIFYTATFLFLITLTVEAESKVLTLGSSDAKVTVKVFSSLTCPHCATFHITVFDKMKKDYIDKGLVKFEHHAFPLDLAALNAEVIVRCASSEEKKFELLDEMYNQQRVWAVGSDINKINVSIKKIGSDLKLSEDNMNDCLKSNDAQDNILNQRIEAQKKYKIKSTPTIIVNEKEYTGKVNYEKFKKIIEKNL